ncbi:hypothetical protein MHK_002679 [Candidatus Magnetomorum sp. HK-1]|nr:hypothetical protein MHK_002679 [Candidatus Magnetomorum sp. HK-1]
MKFLKVLPGYWLMKIHYAIDDSDRIKLNAKYKEENYSTVCDTINCNSLELFKLEISYHQKMKDRIKLFNILS